MTTIPHEFPGASEEPLDNKSPMLFVTKDDTYINYAHNHMNFGNFLWGAAGASLGFSGATLSLGAHYNSVANPTTNGYESQLDSPDDQLSIAEGVRYAKIHKFEDRTWSRNTGVSQEPSGR